MFDITICVYNSRLTDHRIEAMNGYRLTSFINLNRKSQMRSLELNIHVGFVYAPNLEISTLNICTYSLYMLLNLCGIYHGICILLK